MHVLKLSRSYFEATGDQQCFQQDDSWAKAIVVILDTVVTQQRGSDEEMDQPAYTFERSDSVATNTLINHVRS